MNEGLVGIVIIIVVSTLLIIPLVKCLNGMGKAMNTSPRDTGQLGNIANSVAGILSTQNSIALLRKEVSTYGDNIEWETRYYAMPPKITVRIKYYSKTLHHWFNANIFALQVAWGKRHLEVKYKAKDNLMPVVRQICNMVDSV